MALSNAERQRRYREKLKQQARSGGGEEVARLEAVIAELRAEIEELKAAPSLQLSAAEEADRVEVMNDPADPGHLVAYHPWPQDRSALPRFLGWDRIAWTHAPERVIDTFGMRWAVDIWRREWDEHLAARGERPEWDRGELLQKALKIQAANAAR
jgi:hypothetical protein